MKKLKVASKYIKQVKTKKWKAFIKFHIIILIIKLLFKINNKINLKFLIFILMNRKIYNQSQF